MDCSPWLELCSARLDGELTDDERIALDGHLTGCASCREVAAAMGSVHRAVRLRPAPEVPDRTDAILATLEPARRSTGRHRVPTVAAVILAIVVGAGGVAWVATHHPAPAPVLSLRGARADAARAGAATAVYLYVGNEGGQDRLVAVDSPVADRAELHQTAVASGVETMRTVASLPVPATGATDLVPGGAHLMLIGLRDDLAPGEHVPLTLRFARAGAIRVEATVEPV